jgi:hypothetical protein
MNNPCKYSAKSLSEEEEEEKTERKKIKTLINKKRSIRRREHTRQVDKVSKKYLSSINLSLFLDFVYSVIQILKLF